MNLVRNVIREHKSAWLLEREFDAVQGKAVEEGGLGEGGPELDAVAADEVERADGAASFAVLVPALHRRPDRHLPHAGPSRRRCRVCRRNPTKVRRRAQRRGTRAPLPFLWAQVFASKLKN